MKNEKLKTITFDVHIPNLDGDGIAETIPIEVQAYTDPETGEDILTPESLELVEKTQARHMGLMTPEEIRELRERLNLTQEEMSDMLQIGAKSYTRWESGRARPSRSLNVVLCAMRDGVVTTEYLCCLRDGRDWSPLLNRRLKRSIILYQETAAESRSQILRWAQFTGAFEAWREIAAGGQEELGFKEVPQLQPPARSQIKICQSPYAWVENAQAA
jgi:DNA-binding transcriptional regulator YiaG